MSKNYKYFFNPLAMSFGIIRGGKYKGGSVYAARKYIRGEVNTNRKYKGGQFILKGSSKGFLFLK